MQKLQQAKSSSLRQLKKNIQYNEEKRGLPISIFLRILLWCLDTKITKLTENDLCSVLTDDFPLFLNFRIIFR